MLQRIMISKWHKRRCQRWIVSRQSQAFIGQPALLLSQAVLALLLIFDTSQNTKYQNTKIPKYQNTKIPKYQNTKILLSRRDLTRLNVVQT